MMVLIDLNKAMQNKACFVEFDILGPPATLQDSNFTHSAINTYSTNQDCSR